MNSYERTLAYKPDSAEAHNNLGNVLKDQGKLDEAVTSFGRALAHKPDFAEAHYNLGNALQDLGRLEEAVASYRRALAHKPDHAEAHYNLGNALQDLVKLDEAVISYERALEIKSDYVDVLNIYALLLNAQGRSVRALDIIEQSLRIKETREAKNIFIFCIKHLRFMKQDSDIRIAMVRALTARKWRSKPPVGPAASEIRRVIWGMRAKQH